MRFKKRLIPRPVQHRASKVHVPKIENVVESLLKHEIRYENFLSMLEKASDTFFDNPELEFELLISNGLPLEFDGDDIFLKTTKEKIQDQVFCIVDIETNGNAVRKGAQIIELGAVKYQNGKIIDKFESLVYAKEVNEYIQEVTNITPCMLEDAPVIEKVLKEFKLFLGDDVFVAHNISFDYGFISDSFEKYDLGKLQNRKLCSIDLARRTIEAEKYGLSSLKKLLEIDVNNHHRAYYDALATALIFEKLLASKEVKELETVEDLIKFAKIAKQKTIKKPKKEEPEKKN